MLRTDENKSENQISIENITETSQQISGTNTLQVRSGSSSQNGLFGSSIQDQAHHQTPAADSSVQFQVGGELDLQRQRVSAGLSIKKPRKPGCSIS